MEAVPRLPMISFDLKTSQNASFGEPLKQYIRQKYDEDGESYNNEIHNLEGLRCGAIRPTTDIEGIQLLKKYYCQLHFLKSRFPMEGTQQEVFVVFSWKDYYSNLPHETSDIRFELMCILYNIGALHTQLGAMEQRTTPDGMKIACTHFQCAAWAFQMLKQKYYEMVVLVSTIEVISFMELVCLAQAQECILEKSMMDNRKATIIAKVAVEVVNYYRKAQVTLQGGVDETNYTDFVQVGVFKEWVKYLNFKVAYHKCISLLFQGQQAEEQQKMGERVALYQAASEQLEAARKIANTLENRKDITEALAFTSDVIEGKKKAAKNENDFIYHEEIPNKDSFPEIKGASLVKGIPFSITDAEVSGPDIFARLVPFEAHTASSLYSEKKAETLRKYGELIETNDQKLAEFLSSMQIEFLNDMRQATGLPQDIVDRAAALSARPNAIQDLITSMTKLSNSYHEVESLLNEIREFLTEEERAEKEYQVSMGDRPPSIIATDLSREASKYREAHAKANDSNQNLHRAMLTHVANLKALSQPLTQIQQQMPCVKFPDPNIDEKALKEVEVLLAKIDEMKTQRGVLWAQLRDALHKDDITSVLVTKQPDQSLEEIFERELGKHQQLTALIEQNTVAQVNIIKAFIDAYAQFSNTRRYLQTVINKRKSTVNGLISSFDTYEDLLSKANKGVDFYAKLETNVTKLLQRIKSACKVQQEEREQMLSKVTKMKKPPEVPLPQTSDTPKLKDYLDSMKNSTTTASGQVYTNYMSNEQVWPPGVRPTPVGSEINDVPQVPNYDSGAYYQDPAYYMQNKNQFNQYTGGEIEKKLSALTMTDKNDTATYTYPNTVDYSHAAVYGTQHTQYVPNHYQQMNYAQNYAPSTSNHIYASGYAMTQNYQNSGVATVQSGQNTNFSGSLATQKDSNVYGTANTYGMVPQNQYSYAAPSMSTQYQIPGYYDQSQYYDQNVTNSQQNPVDTSKMSQYSEGYVGAGSLTGQNQVNPSYMYTQAGMNFAYNPNNTQSSTGGLTSPQFVQENYSYIPNSTTQSKKESTIDLLAGLEFNISQVPLEPEQKQQQHSIKIEEKRTVEPVKTIQNIPVEDEVKKVEIIDRPKVMESKTLDNEDVKRLFRGEIEKFEKFVEDLCSKTLNGPTNLDLKWKEIQETQESDGSKRIISVARCYPMKNRYPDILPYDHSRVVLKATPDDYINATIIKDISNFVPPLIITQSPLHSTISEFWTMLLEQRAEFVLCLLSDNEIGGEIYWPSEKGKDIHLRNLIISLQSVVTKTHWIERIITINIPAKRESFTIVHLQFTEWPGSLIPISSKPFVDYIKGFIDLYQQQRVHSNNVVIHCSSGIGRSGVACLLLFAILEATNNPTTLPDLTSLTNKITSFRKNILRDREHLKFAYQAFLSYMKMIVSNDGVQLKSVDFVAKKIDSVMKNDDPLSSLDPFWASKKDKA